jgi:hypothetical protein
MSFAVALIQGLKQYVAPMELDYFNGRRLAINLRLLRSQNNRRDLSTVLATSRQLPKRRQVGALHMPCAPRW